MKRRVMSHVQDVTRLTEERLKQLKQLCHPDRHGQSSLSVTVFQWLNEASKELDRRIQRR